MGKEKYIVTKGFKWYGVGQAAAQVVMFWLVMLAVVLVLMGLDRLVHGVEDINREMGKINQKVKVLTLTIKR